MSRRYGRWYLKDCKGISEKLTEDFKNIDKGYQEDYLMISRKLTSNISQESWQLS